MQCLLNCDWGSWPGEGGTGHTASVVPHLQICLKHDEVPYAHLSWVLLEFRVRVFLKHSNICILNVHISGGGRFHSENVHIFVPSHHDDDARTPLLSILQTTHE